LAWAGLGIDRRLARQPMQTEPVFPLRLYMATPEGLFLYQPVPHRLEQVIDRDIRPALAADTTTPALVAGAGCDILLVGSPRSVPSMSLNKGRDFLCTEAGRALQNIQLQAICLDLPYTTIPEFNAKNMAQTCQLTRDMEVFGIISVGIMSGPMALEPAPQTPVAAKKAVLIVPAANFQDEEFFETVAACESASIQTVVASIRRGVIRGIQSRPIEVGILISQLEPADYDSFIFIGGPGISDLAGDPAVLNIIREGVRLKKIVAASSTAAILLADAGVIKGLKVTGYIAEQERLVKAGATYTGKPVEQDRKIITSAGPAVASVFAKTVANAIVAAK
jgi:putative intracellular protease/amidase